MTGWLRLWLLPLIFLVVSGTGLYWMPVAPLAPADDKRIVGPVVGPEVHGASFNGDVRKLPFVPHVGSNMAITRQPIPRIERASGVPNLATPVSIASMAPNRVLEPRRPASALPAIAVSFKGISQSTIPTDNVWPPDPTGDVGRNYYMQAVNHSIGIYDKGGGPLAAFTFHSFFTGTGTLCDTNQRDDPGVVYDWIADRWMFTFFAFSDLSHPFYQCFAVSKTSNPVTGGWWLYAMLVDPAWLDDYPKFALWPDGYYMSANMFRLGESFKGVRVWALDRTEMLSGTLHSVSLDVPPGDNCCFSLLPSNVHGTLPPVGTPNYFLDADTAALGSALHLWKFHVDWNHTISSTFTGPLTLTVDSFSAANGNIVPQLGSTERVDVGDDNLMTALQYRLVNGTESLWAAQTIASSGSTAIRWYEVRDPNGSPLVQQQGTFQPDSNFRWMPSLAVDMQGNMVVGYSVSGAAMYPAIRVAGRLSVDPPGVLSLVEGSIFEGTGSQLGGYSRWGDYSAMSVDPNDDCTFWYTNMYYETTGSNWQTRIGSFSFPSCPRTTAVSLAQFSAAPAAREIPDSKLLLGIVLCVIAALMCAAGAGVHARVVSRLKEKVSSGKCATMAFGQENHLANREETMSDCSATHVQQETFVQAMSERMTQLAQQLSQWQLSAEPTLAEMEQQVLQAVKELGNALLGALASLRAPRYPVQSVPCRCGQQAVYQRVRCAQVDSLLGCIHLKRAYYLCASCHHGQAPLDQQLGFCAGGQSAGLTELLALMGALCPFEEAVQLIQKLSLVSVSANSSKAATEQLGETILQTEQQALTTAWSSTQPTLPPAPTSIPERLYVSMDGTTVHTRAEGWKEIKLGAFYTTTTHLSAKRPEQLDIRAQDISFYADFADPQQFGRALYLEGYRRGAAQAKEVVAIGDGAHWIWKLVAEHFPNAIQIVDWYHASQYVWNAAKAVYGEGTEPATRWAHKRLDELWDGQVPKVLQAFQKQQSRGGEAVQQAISYYRHNQERMRYPEYRARGIQIGSGSIESGCKHLIAQRLKQAGMIWNVAGARSVAKVRARLKSGRWDETIALRQPPSRSYQRSAAWPDNSCVRPGAARVRRLPTR